jgi:hypothetical protein
MKLLLPLIKFIDKNEELPSPFIEATLNKTHTENTGLKTGVVKYTYLLVLLLVPLLVLLKLASVFDKLIVELLEITMFVLLPLLLKSPLKFKNTIGGVIFLLTLIVDNNELHTFIVYSFGINNLKRY